MVGLVSGKRLGVEVRKLGVGAHVEAQDVLAPRGVEHRAAVGAQVDVVGAPVHDGRREGGHEVAGGVELEDAPRAIGLPHVHVPLVVERDGRGVAIVSAPEGPQVAGAGRVAGHHVARHPRGVPPPVRHVQVPCGVERRAAGLAVGDEAQDLPQ